MKTLSIFILLSFCINCFSCKSQNTFSAFDFLPDSTKEAEANGFVKTDSKLLENLSVEERSTISSLYQLQKEDTLLKFFFADEKVHVRTFLFPSKRFDSSELFGNLRKAGDLILHKDRGDTGPMGAFKKGSDVYFVLKAPDGGIALINRPGVDKATRPTGPMIEPRRKQ